MQKIFLAFGLVGLGAMSASFAACSSSSGDDSTTVTDSGSDTSIPTDSGTPDTGVADSGQCATCSQLISQGLAAGSPCAASVPILSAALTCLCNTNPLAGTSGSGYCDGTQTDGGDAGDDSCSNICSSSTATTAVPTSACQACAADNCTAELTACAEDGLDAGTPTGDAGDGGDGG
jgi:hypothetical protein